MAEDTAQVGLTGMIEVLLLCCGFTSWLDVGGVAVDLLLICDVVHLEKTLGSYRIYTCQQQHNLSLSDRCQACGNICLFPNI